MKRGLSFYILIALALATLLALIIMLAPGSAPETPAVHLSLPPAADSAVTPSSAPEAAAQLIEVTPGTVQTAISTLSRADSYSRVLTVQDFWNGGSSTTEIGVWVRGELTRVTLRDGAGDTVKNILIKGGEKWIWYSDAGGVWHGRAREGDADAYQTLLTYEDVLALDKADITDAGYADYNGENCIFVRYGGGALGYENLCYISDRTGLLMGVETYDGDVLVYAMRSGTPDISTPDESIFAEPGTG